MTRNAAAASRSIERDGYKDPTRVFQPIRLRSLLGAYSIAHQDLANAILQARGKPVSRTVLSLLMNYQIWPSTTPAASIKAQVEAYLLSRGVPGDELADAWAPDGDASKSLNTRYANGTHSRRVFPDHSLLKIPEKEMLSQAAKRQFEIFKNPFVDEIRGPDDLYLAADQRYIREAMYSTTKNGGFIAVVGESGAGKSTLRLDLIERIAREGLQILFVQPRTIDKTKLTARMVCEAILGDLAPGEVSPASLEKLARKVETVLLNSYKAGNRHVLMIEEAQDLEPRSLKHLKRFYELQSGYQKLLSIIIVGQPELKDLLDERKHPELREVIRRIEIAELQPLDNNVRAYLEVKFKQAGVKLDDVFTEDAFAALVAKLTHDTSRGRVSMVYPLVVNNVVTRALNMAASLGEKRVSAEVIQGV